MTRLLDDISVKDLGVLAGEVALAIALGVEVGGAQLTFTAQGLPGSNLTYGFSFMPFAVGDYNGDSLGDVALREDPQLSYDTYRIFWGPSHTPPWSPVVLSISGISTVAAGDVGGDGFDDLIIGVGGADTLGTGSGAIMVRYGPTLSVETSHSFMLPIGSVGFGSWVISADFHGDGIDDVATTLWEGTTVVIGPPHLAVLSGPTLSVSALLDLPVWTGGLEAWSWPAVGDFSGDGLPDILWSANPPTGPSGMVLGYPGPTFSTASAVPLIFPLPDPAYMTALVARDWTGDGVADILIGQPEALFAPPLCPTGAVWGFSSPFYSIPGPLFGSWPYAFGRGVAAAGGDVNGDGFEDIAVSALPSCGTGGGIPAGAVRVGYGPTFEVTQGFAGPSAGAALGMQLAIEDLDADGFGEVIASAGGDALVMVFRPKTLSVAPATISLSAGGAATFSVEASPGHAGRAYVLVASGTGTSPGTWVGGVHVPLLVDAWTAVFVNLLNSPLLPGSSGSLGAAGEASPALIVPAGAFAAPSLIGQSFHFAVLLLEAGGGSIRASTNPVAVTLIL